MTTISDYAFESCESLPSVTNPHGVTGIGIYTFKGCKKLTSITIPSTVNSIGRYAFSSCEGLTSIKSFVTKVFKTGSNAFYNCLNATLYVPKGLVETYKSTSDWNKISFIQEMVISYDVNGDGMIDISDVVCIVNNILGISNDESDMCDINCDGEVNINDVSLLVKNILGQ